MRRDLKAKSLLFQVALLGLLSPGAWGEESPSLRFGDAETMMEEKAPPPSVGKESTLKQRKPEFIEPSSDLTERIHKIIASVPPGNDYPAQLEEIVDLGAKGTPVLVGIFQDASSPWQSRWIAGMALGRLGTAAAREALDRGLSDSLFLVRMASIQALSRTGDPAVAPSLRKALLDSALVVRSAAVESLARIKDRDGVSDLIKELSASRNFHRGRSLWIREQIVNALGTIGEKKAIPTLLAVLRENEMNLRMSACSALAKISPDAAPAIAKATDEKCVETWTRWGAVKGVAAKK